LSFEIGIYEIGVLDVEGSPVIKDWDVLTWFYFYIHLVK